MSNPIINYIIKINEGHFKGREVEVSTDFEELEAYSLPSLMIEKGYFTSLSSGDEYELISREVVGDMPISNVVTDFEETLLNLINIYINAGLSKPDLVQKMEYVTQSCKVS